MNGPKSGTTRRVMADAADDSATNKHEVGPWQFDLEAYVREAEPDRVRRADAWQTAIGLQAVDGLKISDYLLSTVIAHIEGRISINTAQQKIVEHYRSCDERSDTKLAATEEGDIVSSRIVRLLGERAFVLSPVQLKSSHRTLFEGLLTEAGEYRTYNIAKREWVLDGDTVLYAPADIIEPTLEYDFGQEQSHSYRGMDKVSALCHVESFVSGVWQIHPFCEGNTRTTAVFAIKYLASLGYRTDNEPFKRHSWYFRNALVRANYEDLERGIHSTRRYLDLFFDNLLLDSKHELKTATFTLIGRVTRMLLLRPRKSLLFYEHWGTMN